jgi:hypothetical protein
MATVNFRLTSKVNKNVSIKIYLSLGSGNFIEMNTGFSINPKDWSNDTDRPKQNNTENKLIFNNLNKDLGDSVVIDAFWLDSKVIECFNSVEKTDTGIIKNFLQEILDNASTRKVKVKGGFKYGI